jgi:hypothetical protein
MVLVDVKLRFFNQIAASLNFNAKPALLPNQTALNHDIKRPFNTPLVRHLVAVSRQQLSMASSIRPVAHLAVRPQTVLSVLRQTTSSSFLRVATTSQFHTSAARYALPSGPPPSGYRLPKPRRFDEGESSLNKASNYFLLTEMMRGAYVVLEQFFRPP